VSAEVTPLARTQNIKKHKVRSSPDKKDLARVTAEINERLIKNTDVLLDAYNCQHVSYSFGLDSSLNVFNSARKSCKLIVTAETEAVLNNRRFKIDREIVVGNFYKHKSEFGTLPSQIDKHFYDTQSVIDGSYGDLVIGHYAAVLN